MSQAGETPDENATNAQERTCSDGASRRAFLAQTAGATALSMTAGLLLGQGPLAHAAAGDGIAGEQSLTLGDVFREIKRDEDEHVSFLKAALGGMARPQPTFKNLELVQVSRFVELAQVFENIGVGAYLLAAPVISNKKYLAAAGSILTIEARHAGCLNLITGRALSANGAFDVPIPQQTIVQDVLPYIASLNGGPNPADTLASDVDILNFALLLEYLEARFYDINVPKFF